MPPPSKQRKRTAKATECQRQNNLKRKELEEQLSESSSESDSGYLSLSCTSDSSESDGEGEAGEKDDCYFESRPPLFGTSTPTAFRRLNTIRGTETLSDWIMVTESNRTATERRMQQQATIPSSSLASLRIPAVSGNLRQATLDKKKRIYRQGLKYTGAAERTRQRHQQLAKKEKAATGGGLQRYFKRDLPLTSNVRPHDSMGAILKEGVTAVHKEAKVIGGLVKIMDSRILSENPSSEESLHEVNLIDTTLLNFESEAYIPGLVQNHHLRHLTDEGTRAIDSMKEKDSWYNDFAINAPLEYICLKNKIAFINSLSIAAPVPVGLESQPNTCTSGFKKFLTPINRQSHWIIVSGVLNEAKKRWEVEIWNSLSSDHLVTNFYQQHSFEHIQAWVCFRTATTYKFTEPKVVIMPRQRDFNSCGAFALESGLLFAHGLRWSFTPVILSGAVDLRNSQTQIIYHLMQARLGNFRGTTKDFEIAPFTTKMPSQREINLDGGGQSSSKPAEKHRMMDNQDMTALLKSLPDGNGPLEDALKQTLLDIETMRKEKVSGRKIWVIYAVKTALELILSDLNLPRQEVYRIVAQVYIPDAGPWSVRRICNMVMHYLTHRQPLPENRGKHGSRMSILNIPEVSKSLDEWLETRYKYTIEDATNWVQTYLRECKLLTDNENVTQQTVRRKLKSLGYMKMMKKKGIFIDGHERPDVVVAREVFLKQMDDLQPQKAVFSSSLPSDLLDQFQAPLVGPRIIDVYQDETVCYFNDSGKFFWGKKGDSILEPKTPGVGVMVSDFICEDGGLLKHSKEDGAIESARVMLVIGNNQDGYFKGEEVCAQLEHAISVFKKVYPGCIGNFIYDNSTNHCAFPGDALIVSRVGWRSGGQKPVMRPTEFVHASQRGLPESVQQKVPQSLVFTEGELKGQPKGCQVILRERGLLKDGLRHKCEHCSLPANIRLSEALHAKDCCGYRILELEPDFKRLQLTSIEEIAKEQGQMLTVLPKYHCELNPIEFTWAELKRLLRNRRFVNLDPAGFINLIQEKLAEIPIHFFRRCFRHVHRWMDGYKMGLTGKMLEATVKKYRSHRKIPTEEVDKATTEDGTIVQKKRKTRKDVVIFNKVEMENATEAMREIDYAAAARVAAEVAGVDTKQVALSKRRQKVITSSIPGTKRVYRCKVCNGIGHNKQNCPNKDIGLEEKGGRKESRNRLALQ